MVAYLFVGIISRAFILDHILAEELTKELRCNYRKVIVSLEEFNADQYVDDENRVTAKSMYEMHDATAVVLSHWIA